MSTISFMSLHYPTCAARLLFVARTFGTHFVVTANLLADGAPVYLRDDRTWSRALTDAAATDDAATRDAWLALANAAEDIVCDPYVIKVELGPQGPIATTARERIRAEGPTTPIRRPDSDPSADRLSA
jgi:hypothetical protein